MKFYFFIISLFCHSLYSQVGFKFIYARPTEDFLFNAKPALAYELVIKGINGKSKLMPRFGFGYARFSPRMAEYPIYNINSSAFVGTSLVPGKLIPSPITLIYLSPGIDFKIKLLESLSVYPGIDLTLGSVASKHSEEFANSPTISYIDKGIYFGPAFRIGADYLYKGKTMFFFDIKRNYNLIWKGNFISYNEYALGVRFKLLKNENCTY